MQDDDDVQIALALDGSAALKVLEDLDSRAQTFASGLTEALSAATLEGKSLDAVLKGLAARLADLALSAGLKPLENLLGNAVSGVLPALGGALGLAGQATPFADGGVVSSPRYFQSGDGLGLMGEAGAEAILPLRRGADGALGVGLTGAMAAGAAPQIVFNVTATDAASFSRSEGQIAAMLARSVGRGQRNL